jgi:pyruvate/2-oxoglutarate/acetoin dehydrogenase E1 component
MRKIRELTYVKTMNETLHQLMSADERIVLIGQGITSPWYVGGTTIGLFDRFGDRRIIDTPVSENAVTGISVGLAISGLRPILEHPRMDFMYLALDQIANHAANWYYMFGQHLSVPLTIWAIINRGGEQAAQHSQALQSIFTHIPGLKVVMPSSPYDLKGLLCSSVKDDNPVVFIDDRWLYNIKGEVDENLYDVPIGKGIIRKEGEDITLIASSYMVHVSMRAALRLEKRISVEVVDLRTLKPLDKALIFSSVRKTGRIVVVDGGWRTCGFSAEVAALISEKMFFHLRAPVKRVALPDAPAPASGALERLYYPDENAIISEVEELMKMGK